MSYHHYFNYIKLYFLSNRLYHNLLDGGPYHIETSSLILLCESMDGFLYDKDLRHERVKGQIFFHVNKKCQ